MQQDAGLRYINCSFDSEASISIFESTPALYLLHLHRSGRDVVDIEFLVSTSSRNAVDSTPRPTRRQSS
eukprot:m.296359 g.296359  ORF g.296359 m.296359 type:complete len:69 (-) comp20057_c0_seq2:1018-1224(-)